MSNASADPELGLVVRPVAGLRVERVRGAAAAAGIQRGDVIVSVNGSPVSSEQELREALSRSAGPAALLIQRGSGQLFLAVPLP